jgi:hypothetical protein
MDALFPRRYQSDEEGFLAAPSVFSADHEACLQAIENNDRTSAAVGFVAYKSTELNRSQYASLSNF